MIKAFIFSPFGYLLVWRRLNNCLKQKVQQSSAKIHERASQIVKLTDTCNRNFKTKNGFKT